MLHRYSNIDFIFNLSSYDGFLQYCRILEIELEDKAWERYLVDLPNMKYHISFEDYLSRIRKPIIPINKKYKTKEDLDSMVDDILVKNSNKDYTIEQIF